MEASASATYQAVLRHEVSSRLGWEWAEPRNNLAELKQWPTSVLRAFSRRREQIEAFLAGGEATWARAQAAAIQTRQAKGAPRDEADDRAAARAASASTSIRVSSQRCSRRSARPGALA